MSPFIIDHCVVLKCHTFSERIPAFGRRRSTIVLLCDVNCDYGLAFARCRWAAHLQRANARLGVLIWHSRAVGERLGFFFSKIQNKPYFSTLALYLALESSLWEHSSASAHLWRANARSYVLIWHSRAVGELLTYSAPMPDKVCWSGIRAL